jgi:PHD/YefM family antitoxin component YafN of YafNO toxin-antitoxin module
MDDMTASKARADLFEMLNQVDDAHLLVAIKQALKPLVSSDFTDHDQLDWDSLSIQLRKELQEAWDESERSSGIAHREVPQFILKEMPQYEGYLARESVKKLFENH